MTTSLAMLFCFLIIVMGALIWYALYRKGDVSAEVAYGKTRFTLQAKEPDSEKMKPTPALSKENAPPAERGL